MKKYKLLIVISALLLALTGALAAYAALSASAKFDGPSTVRLGDTVVLDFKVTCGEIYGMEADLSELGPITRQSVTLNPELTGWEYNIQNGKFILYSNDFATAFKGEDQTLFTLKYKVSDTAAVGNEISVKLENCLLANPMTGDQSDALSASYTKTVQRQLSGNANLLSLKVDGSSVSGFDPDKTEYSLSVDYTVKSVSVSAVCANESAQYTVSGSSLKYGENTVTVRVTAENGKTKDYIIKVIRKDPPDLARLSSLSCGSYKLTPAFDPEVFEYEVSVPYTKKSISFDYTSKNDVTVSGTQSSLKVGENPINIKVVDEFGHENIYKVTVTRRQNNNTNLLKLAIKGYDIVPAFDYTITDYTLTVPASVTTLEVSTLVAGDGASETVTGTELTEYGGVVVVTVTAMDGSTKEYKVTVTKEGMTPPVDPPIEPPIDPPADDAAKLTSLSVKEHTLSPKFSPNRLAYTLSVDNKITSLVIDAKGEEGSELVISGADNLKVGQNRVTITVKASGKEDAVYTITVTRAEAAPVTGNAKLQSITLSQGTLSPVFHPDTFTYVVYLPVETKRLNVTAAGDANATISGTGDYTLIAGSNTVTLCVTLGESKATYTITAYVMPAFDGKLPSIENDTENSTPAAGGNNLSVVGSTQLGGKIVATVDGITNATVRWFRDGKTVGANAEYVVTSKDLGKSLTVAVYDQNGNTVATKTISVPRATATQNTKAGGFDAVGMVISLVAAMATLVIGFILGKSKKKSFSAIRNET